MAHIEMRRLTLVLVALVLRADGFAVPAPAAVCHGEVLYDCIALPEAAGFELAQVVDEGAWTPYPGGAPANVAWALAKLGTSVAFAGAVGGDSLGQQLVAALGAEGVDTSLVRKVAGAPTRTVMVTRDERGERTFAGFGGGLDSSAFADCAAVGEAATTAAATAKWLVQGTLGLAYEGSEGSHLALAAAADANGVTRLVDVNWRPVFWKGQGDAVARRKIAEFASRAGVVKLTDDEAEWLLGVPRSAAMADPARVRRQLSGVKAVLVTAGERGASYDVLGHSGHMPPFSVRSIETTGAGDAFTAGFVHEMLDSDIFSPSQAGMSAATLQVREQIDGAVRFASAVGALTCCGEGAVAAQPTAQQVREFLQDAEERLRVK